MAAFLQKEIILSADRIDHNIIEELVEAVCDHYHIYNSYFGNIMMAVIEATKCNQLFNEKKNTDLVIQFESIRKGLLFKIVCPGGGFNFEMNDLNDDLIEKTEDEYYKSLYLIHALSDEIKISEDKSTLSLIFGTASINKELSVKRNVALQSYIKSGIKEKVEK